LPLFVWGSLKSEEELTRQRVDQSLDPKFPPTPGVFALLSPYEGMCCECDIRCPAKYVNDSKGVQDATPNIVIAQYPKPMELLDGTKGWQMLLQAKATRDIQAGEQLFLNYGKKFWTDEGVAIGSLEQPKKDVDIAQFSESDEEEEKKEATIDVTGETPSTGSGRKNSATPTSGGKRSNPSSSSSSAEKQSSGKKSSASKATEKKTEKSSEKKKTKSASTLTQDHGSESEPLDRLEKPESNTKKPRKRTVSPVSYPSYDTSAEVDEGTQPAEEEDVEFMRCAYMSWQHINLSDNTKCRTILVVL
jgi:hypothetical protein